MITNKWIISPNTELMYLFSFHCAMSCDKGKADDLYRGSMQFGNHCRTALQYPLVHWTLCRCQQYGAFSMKALLTRYQVILLGEQRHIRCEQVAQNNAAVGVEPATSRSRVQRPTALDWCRDVARYLSVRLSVCLSRSFAHLWGVQYSSRLINY